MVGLAFCLLSCGDDDKNGDVENTTTVAPGVGSGRDEMTNNGAGTGTGPGTGAGTVGGNATGIKAGVAGAGSNADTVGVTNRQQNP